VSGTDRLTRSDEVSRAVQYFNLRSVKGRRGAPEHSEGGYMLAGP
jgi:hypothetical protein